LFVTVRLIQVVTLANKNPFCLHTISKTKLQKKRQYKVKGQVLRSKRVGRGTWSIPLQKKPTNIFTERFIEWLYERTGVDKATHKAKSEQEKSTRKRLFL